MAFLINGNHNAHRFHDKSLEIWSRNFNYLTDGGNRYIIIMQLLLVVGMRNNNTIEAIEWSQNSVR